MISGKKSRLFEILDGGAELSSPLLERSSLIMIAEKPRPVLPAPGAAWAAGLPAVATLGFILYQLREHLTDPLRLAGAITAVASGFVGVALWARAGSTEKRGFARSLEAPLKELSDMLAYLQNYQTELDRRTSRYFHCVTSTKVTSYFVLAQIILALRKRTDEVHSLLDDPTRENLLVAHESLSGTLVFRDSLSNTHGNVHVIPLARLKATIVQLIDFIDEEIGLLERELDLEDAAVPPKKEFQN